MPPVQAQDALLPKSKNGALVQNALRAAADLPNEHGASSGRVRWYLVQTPEGKEQVMCERVRRLVLREVLDDAFCLSRERWVKRDGCWRTTEDLMYRGFFLAATRDVVSLDKELSRLTLPVRLLGSQNKAWVSLADEVRDWFAGAMDERHVIRNSTAVIVNGELRVQAGPLVGQEARVSKLNRHKRICSVRLSDADGGFVERMPLEVPFKS